MRPLVLFAFVLSSAPAFGQAKAADRSPLHGNALAAAMEVHPGKLKDTINLADTKNYVFRGKILSLGRDRTVSMCFDAELLRMAGVWKGTPVAYKADKNMGPTLEGELIAATKPGPGWAYDGSWEDPRVGGEGPLPREWGRYRGWYLHGDRVVLAYTVGDAEILELPGLVGGFVARTLRIASSSRPLDLLIADGVEGEATSKTIPQGEHVAVRVAGKPLHVVATGLPEKAKLEIEKGRLILHLPAMAKEQAFRIALSSADLPAMADLDLPVEQPLAFTKGGPRRWSETPTTKGHVGVAEKFGYAQDLIDLPEKNPWNMPIRPAGVDFFQDGRAAICTWDGDVWIVSGLDDKLAEVKWKRFASGLQQPLGIKVVGNVVYVAGRDQVTRLHDLNSDGEADFYECFNAEAGLTLQRHEFVMDLQTDAEGNFYFCRSGHYILSKQKANCCIYKLSPDGKKLEIFARGFREPNGLSIGPDGSMTVGDNEGNGIPQTPLYHLQPGRDYGFSPPINDPIKKGGGWKYAQVPIAWLPKNVDRSAGSQVWVTSKQWGPFEGGLIHESYGNCTLLAVLLDRHAEPWQGAVWKFSFSFASGVMRARFSPADGQLYTCGLRGWDSNGAKDGQLSRIRYTGKPSPVPTGFQVTKQGMRITFSHPLDKKSAEDDQNYDGEWSNPIPLPGGKAEPKSEMTVESVKLSEDGRSIDLAIERIRPMANFTLRYRIKSAAGETIPGELNGSIHRVP
jgi:hypothetical protein